MDLDALGRSVAALEADVVGLQEVDRGMVRTGRQDVAARAGRDAGMDARFGRAIRRMDLGEYGNALLTKGTFVWSHPVRLPRQARRHERRSAFVARIEVGGITWTVGATHLSLVRAEAVEQLALVLGLLEDEDAPRVLLGDLNLLPEDALPVIESLGWSAATTGPSYPSWSPEICIDYVLVDGATVRSAAVIPLEVSDHAAILAEVVPDAPRPLLAPGR